jgi:hypothetical protein
MRQRKRRLTGADENEMLGACEQFDRAVYRIRHDLEGMAPRPRAMRALKVGAMTRAPVAAAMRCASARAAGASAAPVSRINAGSRVRRARADALNRIFRYALAGRDGKGSGDCAAVVPAHIGGKGSKWQFPQGAIRAA